MEEHNRGVQLNKVGQIDVMREGAERGITWRDVADDADVEAAQRERER